ncbi:MAG: TolC family protein, partial [Acidobacteria bacterium]|nr:TolC family protein [Acidobacteriota bacterium]
MIRRGRWVCGVLLVVALAAVTAGCNRSLQRPTRASIVKVPDAWTGGQGVAAAGEGDWWTSFGDEDLDRVVARVLERNQDLRAAGARIEAARAQARIASAAQLPQLDASFDLGGRKQNFLGLRLPGAEGSVLSRTFSSTGLSLNLGWEADLWGKVKAGKLAAMAGTQARQAELAAARLSLSAQAARAWFGAIEAHRQVELARSSVESYGISAGRIRARFEGGVRPALDLRLALAELRIAEAALQSRLELADRGVRQLQILMGDYPDGSHELGKDLPEGPEQVPTGLPSELVHRRADLVAAERDLLAADARIVEAKAQLRPRFSLTSTFGTSSDQLRRLLSAELLVWSLIGNVVQPVFNRGRLKAGVTLNQA